MIRIQIVKIMFAFRILFIVVSFAYCNCYTRRVQDVIMNKNVVRLINSYIKPLSEKFPNHELEIQVDIQQPPVHHMARSFSRRKVHLRKPSKILLRKGHESKVSPKKPKPTVKSTTKAPTHPSSTATSSAPTTHAEKSIPKKEAGKVPVYKEELQKALDELEKKINTNIIQRPETYQDAPQLLVSNFGPVTGGSHQNINRIIELIRKGIHFQKHVPNTDDDNMEWMQIKIPKNLNNDKKLS